MGRTVAIQSASCDQLCNIEALFVPSRGACSYLGSSFRMLLRTFVEGVCETRLELPLHSSSHFAFNTHHEKCCVCQALAKQNRTHFIRGKMAPRSLSRSGCWTCRIRHKKCDEVSPKCLECESRAITCHGYGRRPPWMNDPVLLSAEKQRIKRIVNHNFRRSQRVRRNRTTAPGDHSEARTDSQDIGAALQGKQEQVRRMQANVEHSSSEKRSSPCTIWTVFSPSCFHTGNGIIETAVAAGCSGS